MGYESYFRDPQFRKQADKIMLEFKKIRKTLLKINSGLKTDIDKLNKLIEKLKTENEISNELIEHVKNELYDIKIDMYALIEKGESIISEMKVNFFKKSSKLEFKNREIIQEYYELIDIIKNKVKEIEEVLENAGNTTNKGENRETEDN